MNDEEKQVKAERIQKLYAKWNKLTLEQLPDFKKANRLYGQLIDMGEVPDITPLMAPKIISGYISLADDQRKLRKIKRLD